MNSWGKVRIRTEIRDYSYVFHKTQLEIKTSTLNVFVYILTQSNFYRQPQGFSFLTLGDLYIVQR